VGEGFVPDAKRGRLRLYVKCRGGEEVCEKLGLSLGRFFSFFFFFFLFSFLIKSLLCLRYKRVMQR